RPGVLRLVRDPGLQPRLPAQRAGRDRVDLAARAGDRRLRGAPPALPARHRLSGGAQTVVVGVAVAPRAVAPAMVASSDYRELPPPAALAEYLVCTWTQTTGADAAGTRPRIVPDGCIDVVWIGDAAPRVVGPMTRP